MQLKMRRCGSGFWMSLVLALSNSWPWPWPCIIVSRWCWRLGLERKVLEYITGLQPVPWCCLLGDGRLSDLQKSCFSIIRVTRNLSCRGNSSWGGTPDPWMATVSLPSRVWAEKWRNEEIWRNYCPILGILSGGGGYCPHLSSLATPVLSNSKVTWPTG